MREAKITFLVKELCQYIQDKVVDKGYTLGEVESAMGIALGTIMYLEGYNDAKAGLPLGGQPVEEEEEEEEEEGFELKSLQEVRFAFDRLYSKYPFHEVRLILEGKRQFPFWLRKEINMRREQVSS